jgi:hypothetical protein
MNNDQCIALQEAQDRAERLIDMEIDEGRNYQYQEMGQYPRIVSRVKRECREAGEVVTAWAITSAIRRHEQGTIFRKPCKA